MRKFIFVFLIICLIFVLVFAASRFGDVPVQQISENTLPENVTPETPSSAGPQAVASPVYTYRVAYANWSEDAVITRSCINGSFFVYSDMPRLPLYRVSSVKELDGFRSTFENVLELHRGYGEIPSFDEQTSGCDDSFFNDNDLLITYVTASSGSFRFGLSDIKAEEDALRMYVIQTVFPQAYTDDMAGWFIIASISKIYTSEYDSFDAVRIPDRSVIPDLPGMLEYGEFSYSEALAGLDKESSNVKTEGFVNTDAVTEFLPVERAKSEAAPGYDLIKYFHDEDEDVWLVHFFSSDDSGKETFVYMNGKGVTLLVVYCN